MIRSQLQFLTSSEHFDRFFAYKVFGRIKRTTVKVLSLENDQTLDDYVFRSKAATKIGDGIHFYYSFSFAAENAVRCAFTSHLHDSGHVTLAKVFAND